MRGPTTPSADCEFVVTRRSRDRLLVTASLVAIGNLWWWALDGVRTPLFWDDAYMVECARDLLTHPLEPRQWSWVLSGPMAFAFVRANRAALSTAA